MYEQKKNSGRKDMYKHQKSSYQKNFYNSTHFGHHKYNKFKQKYSHSNSLQDYDEETIFSQIFDSNNESTKKKDLKEIEELTPTHQNYMAKKTLDDNKENISLNINSSEQNTRMRTDDVNDITENETEKNKNEIKENENENQVISPFNNESCCKIFGENLNCDDDSEQKMSDINNVNIYNNINFNNNKNINITNINFNVENELNELFQKNNEYIFVSNEKENIHLDFQKNIYNTPQPFKANSSSSINLSSNDMKEAFYIPKKLSTIYDMYSTQQQNSFFDKRRNSLNNFNYMTIQRPNISLSNKHISNCNHLGINNNLNLNYFKSNNNNSPNIPISSFNLFDSNNNINNLGPIGNIPNLNNLPNIPQNSNNPFHNMMPQMELNQCILKTQINNNNLFEKDKENTDILEINVKVSKEETLTFKIRRYDDMFKTVKIFCEINKLDIKLIRPFIIYIIRALNSIYGIYNLNLKEEEIQILKYIKDHFYKNEEKRDDTKEAAKEEGDTENKQFNEEEISSDGEEENEDTGEEQKDNNEEKFN